MAMETLAGMGIFAFVLIMLLVAAASILVFVFWIWMIVDCAKRRFKSDTEKIVWILVIIFTSWIGALIYYFVVKREDRK